MNPKFSVIVPTLNEEVYLPRLLESLYKQERRDFEVLVVDAHSEDKTVVEAGKWAKKMPTLKVLESEKGVSKQRNKGVKVSRGEWLVFADADSQLMPECLKEMADYLDGNPTDIATSWFWGDRSRWEDVLAMVVGGGWLELYAHSAYPWAPGAFCVVRREVFDALHGFDEKLSLAEDQDLSIRAVKKGYRFSIVRKPLFRYSLRRFRRFGYIGTAWVYVVSGLSILTKKLIKMPRFSAGGQLYEDKDNGDKISAK